MDKTTVAASAITFLLVLAVVVYRLLWAASAAASATALGRLSILPRSWRRWLLHDHRPASR
jgi:hypothetical protein